MKHKCIKAYISGHVQGVFFRDSTRTKALSLMLNGYAKNLADGRVEVLACGNESELNKLIDWLHHGPQYAEVSEVIVEDCVDPVEQGFKIG